jgi:hypothetical protein
MWRSCFLLIWSLFCLHEPVVTMSFIDKFKSELDPYLQLKVMEYVPLKERLQLEKGDPDLVAIRKRLDRAIVWRLLQKNRAHWSTRCN